MARWTASAKWAVGPALDGQCDMPLVLRLSEGLGLSPEIGACCIGLEMFTWKRAKEDAGGLRLPSKGTPRYSTDHVGGLLATTIFHL